MRFRLASTVICALALALAASIAPGTRAAEAPAPPAAALSADGRLLAYEVRGEAHALLIRDLVTDRYVLRIVLGQGVVRDLVWLGDGALLLVGGADPTPQPFLVRLESRKVFPLRPPGRWVEFGRPTVRVTGGRPVAFLEGRLDRALGLYRIGLDEPFAERIEPGSPLTEGWIIGPDGGAVAEAKRDLATGRWTLQTHAATGWREAVALPLTASPRVLGLGHDGRGVVYAMHGPDGWSWRVAPLDAGPSPAPLPAAADDAPILDPSDDRVIGRIATVDGTRRWDFFEEADNAAWDAATTAFHGGDARLLGWDPERRRILVTAERPGHGAAPAIVDLGRREAVWLDAEAAPRDAN